VPLYQSKIFGLESVFIVKQQLIKRKTPVKHPQNDDLRAFLRFILRGPYSSVLNLFLNKSSNCAAIGCELSVGFHSAISKSEVTKSLKITKMLLNNARHNLVQLVKRVYLWSKPSKVGYRQIAHKKMTIFVTNFKSFFLILKLRFYMEATDYLAMKTTNINLRVSPLLKMQIMQQGAKMSANLSDYIGFVLTKEMTGANAPPDPKESPEYRELAQLLRGARLEIQKYETALAPFAKQWVGKEVQIDGKMQKCNTPQEALNYLVNSFKIRV
jgi:hypothetical protein